jgi:hypothetical protein
VAWELRRGRKYYYRSRKVAGRVVREYVGAGEAAELAARLDAIAAEERQAQRRTIRASRTEFAEMERIIAPLNALVDECVAYVMIRDGFHLARGRWRKKRRGRCSGDDNMTAPDATPPVPALADAPPDPPPGALTFTEVVRRARSGDRSVMPYLNQLFDDPSAIDANGGNVAEVVAGMFIAMMVGQDLLTREAIFRKMEYLRNELVGPDAPMLERLVADRIVSTWLQLHRLESTYTFIDESDTEQLKSKQDEITTVQKRYFAAIRQLVEIRQRDRLALQVNIAREQVNVVGAP